MRITFLLVTLVFLNGCVTRTGSGNIISENRNVPGFNVVEVSGPIEVRIAEGDFKVNIESDDNLIKYIDCDVSDGVLKLRLSRGNFRNAVFRANVTAPQLKKLEASAAGQIEMINNLKATTLEIRASSGGSVNGGIDAPEVKGKASSGGEINIKGRTKNLSLEASSGGEIKAETLLSESADADASSGGSISLHASVKLNAKASGGGSIRYTGGATVNQRTSGGGDVSRF